MVRIIIYLSKDLHTPDTIKLLDFRLQQLICWLVWNVIALVIIRSHIGRWWWRCAVVKTYRLLTFNIDKITITSPFCHCRTINIRMFLPQMYLMPLQISTHTITQHTHDTNMPGFFLYTSIVFLINMWFKIYLCLLLKLLVCWIYLWHS